MMKITVKMKRNRINKRKMQSGTLLDGARLQKKAFLLEVTMKLSKTAFGIL